MLAIVVSQAKDLWLGGRHRRQASSHRDVQRAPDFCPIQINCRSQLAGDSGESGEGFIAGRPPSPASRLLQGCAGRAGFVSDPDQL
jgi:hypothetical protein